MAILRPRSVHLSHSNSDCYSSPVEESDLKALVLIFSLLMVTNSAHAAESLMELIEKTFEQLKTPGVFDPSCNCYVGRDTQVNETESLVCKDLYEGACQFEDDKKKRINGKLKESQTQLIYDAFDVAAKAAGHKDFKSAYLKRLTEAGLARVDDITLSRMKELFELDPYVSEYSADKYFKEVAKCKADAKALEEKTEDYDEEDDIEELESIRNRIQIFQKDQNDQIEKLFVETPTDLYDSIREECDDLRDDLDEILEKPFIDQPKKIPDMPSVCGSKSLYQMKTQAIDLFRQSDSPDILEKRKAFVRKLMPTLLLLKPIDFDDADEDEDPDDDDVDPKVLALRREIDSARKFAIDEACDVMGLASEKAFEKVSVDFRELFIRSKPFVEALLASNYTPKRRETMGTNLEFSKEAIAEFLNEVVAPRSPQAKALVKKILPQLQSLNHSWAKNPPDNMYTTNPKTGL
ncbi:MAG: hypothetical protein KDD25_09055, partial [Bdellovibrionales bacterium]|nr:hypothetical protein [Bdellovibrionales bacterium]